MKEGSNECIGFLLGKLIKVESRFETRFGLIKCGRLACLGGFGIEILKMIPIVLVPVRLTRFFAVSQEKLSKVNFYQQIHSNAFPPWICP
ncbi:hypothetical protein [Synechococcus sp. WH 8016]|uniref:hypothetical protein n=1 Tax=Synechococcus sp. WH 8016 TaxID=166318 RepID=UPI0002EA96E5|nr:hypothetical protein [Synechococcus sp. WH 8016]